ncbi:MAG: type I restriction enzyme HsdR N-terminal domain-containing protein [Chitinophagaceae bacterium]
MIAADLLQNLQLNIRTEGQETRVWDILRKRWMLLTPEEHVRQALIHYLIRECAYPAGMIAIERQISYGLLKKRYDLVVYDRHREPWLLAECKAPEVPLSEKVLHHLLHYRSRIPAPFWLLSNGHDNYCADATDLNNVCWLTQFPSYPR